LSGENLSNISVMNKNLHRKEVTVCAKDICATAYDKDADLLLGVFAGFLLLLGLAAVVSAAK